MRSLHSLLAELRTAETPIASTVHEPFGSPAGPGLFHVKGLQLPAYIQHVAHHLVGAGHDESSAIRIAVGVIRDWAEGHDGHGHHVHPDVQAAAAKALAEWEAAKGAAHADSSNGRSAVVAQTEYRAKYNAGQLQAMAAKGQAMKNANGEPSYPIADEEDLHNAIHAVGRGGGSHDAIRKHIIARAKALGLSSAIPDNWGSDGSNSDSSDGGRDWSPAEVERRFTAGIIEVRADTDGHRIGGYGAVFGRLSKNLGGFVERVDPGAFNQAKLDGWPNVVARYNHDPNMVLGTTASGTLHLRTDNIGLDYDVLPPQARADILELVQRGDIRYSSFAFRVPDGGDAWTTTRDTNYPMRTLNDVVLVDVAPVLDPAYPDATAGLRSLAAAKAVPVDEVRSMAEHDELRRLFIRTDRPSYQAPKPKVTAAAAMMRLMEKRRDPFA